MSGSTTLLAQDEIFYKEKDYAISVIRFIAMLLIIFCHILQYYGNDLAYLLNVGVPIFFCVSGYLYGGKEIKNAYQFIKKNYFKLLLDYWVVLSLTIIIYYIGARELLSKKNNL